MGIISPSPTIGQDNSKPVHAGGGGAKSMAQGTAVGGGSRPTPSKVKLESSAPMEPHTLGRAPGDWLK